MSTRTRAKSPDADAEREEEMQYAAIGPAKEELEQKLDRLSH